MQLAGVGVHRLCALAPVVLLWTPSCILENAQVVILDNDLQVCILSSEFAKRQQHQTNGTDVNIQVDWSGGPLNRL